MHAVRARSSTNPARLHVAARHMGAGNAYVASESVLGVAQFGQLLRQYRLTAGLTQDGLADRAGLSRRGLSDLERGLRARPYVNTIERLARAMSLTDMQLAELLAAAGRQRHGFSKQPLAPFAHRLPMHNLPLQLTSFIGRKRELIEVERMLHSTRLLTFTGSGGAGKTRLALEVAANVLPTFRDGVRWVELASLADSSLVPQAIVAAVGVREETGRSLLSTLESYIDSKQLLLILDNCEHLAQVCADVAVRLLRRCPQLRILATSRQRFGLDCEIAWRVPSMAIPDPGQPTSDAEFSQIEAVRLFVERATAARPGFQLTNDNRASIARICSQLEGIPLALELAAARVGILSVTQIAARLEDRFRLLTTGSQSALPRQQTLRASVDWSYGLLSAPEQTLLDRLAVFAGEFGLEAAEPICAGGNINHADILDLLAKLVDKSLVVADERLGEMRYRLLETLRQYGLEHLATSQQLDRIRQQHAAYFLQLTEASLWQLRGPCQAEWLTRMDHEYDNLRAALRWYVDRMDVEAALRFGASLAGYWHLRGHLTEGRQQLDQLLSLSQDPVIPKPQTAARAAALGSAGHLAWRQGDFGVARLVLEESLAIFRQLGDRWGAGTALNSLGEVAAGLGELTAARSRFEESLVIFRSLGNRWWIGVTLTNLGELAYSRGDLLTARLQFEESLTIFRELGDRWGNAVVLNDLGEIATAHSDDVAAQSLFEDSLAIFRELGERQKVAALLNNLGGLAEREDDAARARPLFAESLTIFRELGDQRGIAYALEGVARVAATEGKAYRALRLAAAAAALRATTGARRRIVEEELHQHVLMRAEQALSATERASAWAEGKLMTLEKVIAYALEEPVVPGLPLSIRGAGYPKAHITCHMLPPE